jgi:hypothetical protein
MRKCVTTHEVVHDCIVPLGRTWTTFRSSDTKVEARVS